MPDQAPDPRHGRQCVLLFGMPRSGTTWLGKLFDSHPDVLYRHEPDTWRAVRIDSATTRADSHRERELREFMGAMPSIRAIRVAGKRPLFPKRWMPVGARRLSSAAIELARVASRVYPDFPVLIHASGSGYSERVMVWKSIQLVSRIGPALRILDQARGIHILRHPCGYIASVRRGVSSNSFSNSGADSNVYGMVSRLVGSPIGDQFGFDARYKQYLSKLTPEERLAWMWVLSNEQARQGALGSDRYLSIRYEDVCRDPEAEVARMFDFAGLRMQPQTEAFIAESTGKSRDGYYSVYKDPEVSAWRWQDELDRSTIDRVMAIAGRSEMGREYLDLSPSEAARS